MTLEVENCETCPFLASCYDEFSMGSAWTHICNLKRMENELFKINDNYFIEGEVS